MSTKIQVIFYSTYGHVFRLAEAIAEGCRSVSGVEVEILRVAETLPEDVIAKMGATEAHKAFAKIPIADPRKLQEADGIILGCPTRYGSAPAQMRAFLNIRIHGESSPHSLGAHDICTLRNTRSGCGMKMVKRPSGVVRPVTPPGEPLGLYG